MNIIKQKENFSDINDPELLKKIMEGPPKIIHPPGYFVDGHGCIRKLKNDNINIRTSKS